MDCCKQHHAEHLTLSHAVLHILTFLLPAKNTAENVVC